MKEGNQIRRCSYCLCLGCEAEKYPDRVGNRDLVCVQNCSGRAAVNAELGLVFGEVLLEVYEAVEFLPQELQKKVTDTLRACGLIGQRVEIGSDFLDHWIRIEEGETPLVSGGVGSIPPQGGAGPVPPKAG